MFTTVFEIASAETTGDNSWMLHLKLKGSTDLLCSNAARLFLPRSWLSLTIFSIKRHGLDAEVLLRAGSEFHVDWTARDVGSEAKFDEVYFGPATVELVSYCEFRGFSFDRHADTSLLPVVHARSFRGSESWSIDDYESSTDNERLKAEFFLPMQPRDFATLKPLFTTSPKQPEGICNYKVVDVVFRGVFGDHQRYL